jgi:hypothetical protein
MGEPLLNPLLERFVRHVAAEAQTSFASNGSALTGANVRSLIDAGLDQIYLSFNGDEPEVYARMMGGLSFERVLGNVRQAVQLARGTQLKLLANVSITKANRDRVTAIRKLLEAEGVGPVTFSLCHNRGGNLQDPAVCDTPPMNAEHWECDVMKRTLFVDWQGKAHICDHDLHGEYVLGDLMSEPLNAILERRSHLVADNSGLKICRQCNDVMKMGGTLPLESGAGGDFRNWLHYLFADLSDPLGEANPAMRWIFQIYSHEGRLDRLVNRLIRLERAAHAVQSSTEKRRMQTARELEQRNRELDERNRELNERDREFAELHRAYVRLRRSFGWRIQNMLVNDVRRVVGFARKLWRLVMGGAHGPPAL